MIDNIQDLYNQEAEENLVGILLVDSRLFIKVSSLIEASDLYQQDLRDIYSTIRDMYNKGKVIDIVTVSEQLKFDQRLEAVGGRGRINELALAVTSTVQYKQYCKIIAKYSKKRKLLGISDNIKEALNDNVDVDDVLQDVITQTNKMMLTGKTSNTKSIIDGVDSVLEEICQVLESEHGTFGLPTGFDTLDKTISGLSKSKLYIIAARPRVGKSFLAQQIAENVAQTHNVLFHSLEMKSDQYTKRSIFRRTGLSTEILTRKMISVDEAMAKAAKSTDELVNLKLYIDDTSAATLQMIERNIIQMREDKGSCDLVVIDYAQLMGTDDKRQKDRFAIVSANSTGLKQLANKYNVPILLLAQLSRRVDERQDHRPILSDLKDSGNFEQDADVIMFIYRESIYNPDPRYKYDAELIVAKNREGTSRSINMIFNGSKDGFVEALNNQKG